METLDDQLLSSVPDDQFSALWRGPITPAESAALGQAHADRHHPLRNKHRRCCYGLLILWSIEATVGAPRYSRANPFEGSGCPHLSETIP